MRSPLLQTWYRVLIPLKRNSARSASSPIGLSSAIGNYLLLMREYG